MKKLSWFIALAALAAPALAFAGGGEKCSATDASACLSHWAEKRNSAWMGASYDKGADGTITVKEVYAGSPADKAGIKKGDVLMALNGASFADKEAIKAAKADWKVGATMTYTIKRGNAEKKMAVTLAPMPEAVFAQMVGEHVVANHMTATAATPAPSTAQKTSN
jgi:predicted metalloprotease with PDZ domain